jgi:hypothetical protein
LKCPLRCPSSAAEAAAAKEYPKHTLYQIWLAQALVVTGDRPGAMAAYRKAAELFPHDETINNELASQNYKYMIDKGLKDLCGSEPKPKDP